LFIEPNSENEFDRKLIPVTREHEDFVLNQVRDSWEKIQDHDFYTGCGKPDCNWCNFIKEHKLYASLEEVDITQEEKESFSQDVPVNF